MLFPIYNVLYNIKCIKDGRQQHSIYIYTIQEERCKLLYCTCVHGGNVSFRQFTTMETWERERLREPPFRYQRSGRETI